MAKILNMTYLRNTLSSIFRKEIIPLELKNFTQIKTITDDVHNNNLPNGYITIKLYDKLNNNMYAGYISYRVYIGQVGLFVLEKEYRDRGLGKQILSQTIEDMKNHNASHIWAVTIDDNHPFWSNVLNKSFQWYDIKQLHPTVTGCGYKMKI